MGNVLSRALPKEPLVNQTGQLTFPWLKWFNGVGQSIDGFDQNGSYQGRIGANATITGHTAPLATVISKLSDTGVIDPSGLPAATDTEQGAVVMPSGAPNNHLGSAAIQPSTAFDVAGAAAAAQTAAAADATTKANAAQANSEAYTDSKFAAGLTVTIVTAALTTLGTQGSMDFTNGLLTAQTPAT